jgi:thiaminase (transcriptional activator TenA)
MTFTEIIRKAADAEWQSSLVHPFVTGIADGTLPIECFKFYVLQDSYYLSQFAKVQALGSAKADDLSVSGRMAKHVLGTYQAELSLHEKFMKQLDITEEEKTAFEPAPTAYAYTSHLLRSAYSGHLGDILAALLPCYWLYYDIGHKLADARPNVPVYQEWIAAYGGEWFEELVHEQLDGLNAIADQVSDSDRERMKQEFVISSRYELMFWEMAYRRERWMK